MELFERIFKLKSRGSNIFNEIMGGFIIFISLIYILPTNSGILSGMGMNPQGVFFTTAFASCFACLVMGLLANFPVVLSSGMGLNAFLVYTVSLGLGFSRAESMIILFTSGLIYLLLALTPALRTIINKIPANLKYIISTGLGGFLCIIGLLGGGNGIIKLVDGIPSLNSLAEPHVIIPFVGFIVIILLMLLKKPRIISKMAIPIGVLLCAIVSLSINYGCYGGENTALSSFSGTWGFDSESVKDVFLFGTLKEGNESFGSLLASVFTNPTGYLAIFAVTFTSIFDATATTCTVGADVGLINDEGLLVGGKRMFIANGISAASSGPFGTSLIVPFAESSLGSAFGAKTGICSITAGILFFISSFIYPVFSVFSSWSVSAPALIAIGGVIFANNIKKLDWKDVKYGFIAFFVLIFMMFSYSISTGIGIGIIIYVLINLITNKRHENNYILYILFGLYIVYFVLNEVIKFL